MIFLELPKVHVHLSSGYVPICSDSGNMTRLKGAFGIACKFGLLEAILPVAAAV